VFDAHNAETVLHHAALAARASVSDGPVRRLKDWALQRRIEAAEKRAVAAADVVWTCSRNDSGHIASAFGRVTGVTVVPNGLDVDAYRRSSADPVGADWSGLPITLFYSGLYSYPPNADAAMRLVTEVLPAVRSHGYRARAVLVGQNPTPSMQVAARADGEVEVTGTVETVLPFIERPCIVMLPIRIGSGTRLKIVEAFAVGRPVVSTMKGAEGIAALDGKHLLLREDAASMAIAAIELWNQPRLRESICAEALELARDQHSWGVAAERIRGSLGVGVGKSRSLSGSSRRLVAEAP
jgi:glycosyltransferase involved in cell wall biosynthesis